MSGMLALVREVVARELAAYRASLLGVVTATFPHAAEDDTHNYEVNVRLRHEDLELEKVPVATSHLGTVAPLRVDDLVLVHFVNGDLNLPVVLARFYDAAHRPPLHADDELLWEHRVADGTLNHLRLAADGSILLQRDVKVSPGQPAKAKASLTIDGKEGDIEIKTAGEKPASIRLAHASGNIEIRAGDAITVLLKNDGDSAVEVATGGKPIKFDCNTMTLTGDLVIEKGLSVSADLLVKGKGKIGQTEIKGNTITGGA